MKKLFLEVIKNKIFALWIVVATLAISVVALTYEVNDTKTERFSIINFNTVEKLNEEICVTEIELQELSNDPYAPQAIRENLKQKLFVLQELRAHDASIDFNKVYQGVDTSTEDETSFVFNNQKYLLILSLISAIILTSILFTREFDEGVFIHIYYKRRTLSAIKRLGALVIVQTILYFSGYFMLRMFGNIYPHIYDYGVIVDNSKAYFVNITQYEILYGMFRYYYMILFATLLFFLVAIIFKKTLPTLIVSALLTGAYLIFE